MNHIINKVLLFSATIILSYKSTDLTETKFIISLLLSLSAAMIFPALCNEGNKQQGIIYIGNGNSLRRICEIFICAYFSSFVILKPAFLFAGLVSYDIYRYRQRLSLVFLALSTIYMFSCFPPLLIITEVCIMAISFTLSIYSSNLEKLRSELLTIMDNTAEHDMLVSMNTRQLLENQDNMITNATLSERNRIAREIHDNVGHLLTRSILQTGAIKVINKDEKLDRPLDQLQSTLDTAMDSMRKSVHDLHDEAVDLKSAIEEIAGNVQNFDVYLDYDMGGHIPKDIKYSFINIVKEAVNNAVKHSSGNHISIKLHEHPAFYQLLVSDNGHNVRISPGNADSGDVSPGNFGIGLTNICERVNMLGGTMKISVTNGFSILVTVMKKEGE